MLHVGVGERGYGVSELSEPQFLALRQTVGFFRVEIKQQLLDVLVACVRQVED